MSEKDAPLTNESRGLRTVKLIDPQGNACDVVVGRHTSARAVVESRLEAGWSLPPKTPLVAAEPVSLPLPSVGEE